MRLTSSTLHGIIPALVTPFNAKDEVDTSGLKRLVDYVVENSVHGLMTTGGNGEFPHLLHDERKKVLEVVRDRSPSKVPVIACVSACGTREVTMLAAHAKNVGADAVILTPPYYFDLPSSSILEHFKLLAETVDIPVVVYNNPTYTRHNITPSLMVDLSKIDGVIGMKQSNSNISEAVEILRLVGKKIAVLTGIDSQLFASLAIGGKGVFSTAACVYPRQMVDLYEAFERGDQKTARRIHEKLQVVNKFFEYEPGYVTPCKEALTMLGLPAGPVRKPMPLLTQNERTRLKKALQSIGLKPR